MRGVCWLVEDVVVPVWEVMAYEGSEVVAAHILNLDTRLGRGQF